MAPRSRVYIAGPMTGYEHYNAPAFRAAAEDWAREGWVAITPLETNNLVWRKHYGRDFDPTTDKCDYGHALLPEMLLENFRALLESDAVAVLSGWEKSKGATLEVQLAKNLFIPVFDANLFVPLKEKQKSVLVEAEGLVDGDRQSAYGHPFDDYTRTGTIWGGILHEWAQRAAKSATPIPVPPELAVLCMVGVKMSREVNKPKRDNRVDMAGYTKCLDLVRDRQEKKA